MPLHLEDLDVISEVRGLRSALIVPCNMCPGITVAVNEHRPFLELFRSPFRSAPFEEHIRSLQSRLQEAGVRADVFRSDLYNQWFLCMWTGRRRDKLRRVAARYDAVIVLGCDTATVTVRDALSSTGCTVVEGMEVVGYMNAKLRLGLPGTVSFADCRVVPMRHAAGGEALRG
jgi:hypothetical protein